jgi:hypothetical protein
VRVFYFHDVCSWFPWFRPGVGDVSAAAPDAGSRGALRADVPPRTRWPRATAPFPTRRIVLGVASAARSDLVIRPAGSRATTGFALGELLFDMTAGFVDQFPARALGSSFAEADAEWPSNFR